MTAAVQNFNARVQEFEAAGQEITGDVNALASTWQGDGYTAFTGAMGKWNVDITNVYTDLSKMSTGVQQSNQVIHEVDANIMKAFNQY